MKHDRFVWGASDFSVVKKYAPDQARDEHGRWTDEGGGGSLWTRPPESNIRQEYNVEYQHHFKEKYGDLFPTFEAFKAAVDSAQVVSITREANAKIANRSNTSDFDELHDLISTYRSYPKYRNENTLRALDERIAAGKPTDMPIIMQHKNGRREIFSGNTRMDIGFWHADTVDAVVVDLSKVQKSFNPDQPRDERGRWSADGVGGSITSEVRDYSGGDNYGSIYARDKDGNVIGGLDFAGNTNSVLIQNVEVKPEYRRQGVASKLIDRLVSEFGGAKLEWGMTTPEGTALREAYERVNPPNDDITQRLELDRSQGVNNENVYSVKLDGKEIAYARLSHTGEYAVDLGVKQEYRRKGVATWMYNRIEQDIGYDLKPSPVHQTEDGKAFWASRGIKKFNPDQPRVPAGSPEGGQFAPADGGGSGGGAVKIVEISRNEYTGQRHVEFFDAAGNSLGQRSGAPLSLSNGELIADWNKDRVVEIKPEAKPTKTPLQELVTSLSGNRTSSQQQYAMSISFNGQDQPSVYTDWTIGGALAQALDDPRGTVDGIAAIQPGLKREGGEFQAFGEVMTDAQIAEAKRLGDVGLGTIDNVTFDQISRDEKGALTATGAGWYSTLNAEQVKASVGMAAVRIGGDDNDIWVGGKGGGFPEALKAMTGIDGLDLDPSNEVEIGNIGPDGQFVRDENANSGTLMMMAPERFILGDGAEVGGTGVKGYLPDEVNSGGPDDLTYSVHEDTLPAVQIEINGETYTFTGKDTTDAYDASTSIRHDLKSVGVEFDEWTDGFLTKDGDFISEEDMGSWESSNEHSKTFISDYEPSEEQLKERFFEDQGNPADFVNEEEDFTGAEDQALQDYKGSGHQNINSHLRGNDEGEDVKEQIALIDAAMQKSVINEDVVVYRGLSSGSRTHDDLFNGGARELIGHETPVKTTFQSVSLSIDQAENFKGQVMWEITVPKGTHAINMERSWASGKEAELLLPRGGAYFVEGVDKARWGNGITIKARFVEKPSGYDPFTDKNQLELDGMRSVFQQKALASRFVDDDYDLAVLGAFLAAVRAGKVKKYNESQPRDEKGRWTDGSGNIVAYHGTTQKVVDSILKDGIKIGGKKNFDDGAFAGDNLYDGDRGQSVFVTSSYARAVFYADRSTDVSKGKPVVIELNIPDDKWKSFVEDEHDTRGRRTVETIPPEWITRIYKAGGGSDVGTIYERKVSKARTAYVVIFVEDDEVEKYDPDQPRDDHGRWSSGDGGAGSGSSEPLFLTGDANENARRFEVASKRIAKELGFDVNKVDVAQGVRTFQLNGKTFNYAGAADLKTGRITIFSDVASPSELDGLVAHEVMHQNFEAFRAKARDENAAVMALPMTGSHATDPMKADGSLREPYASQFPIYSAWNDIWQVGGDDGLAATDGVTDYSKEWWTAWKSNLPNVSIDQPVHETLAEMARVKRTTGKLVGAPRWRALYELVERYSK